MLYKIGVIKNFAQFPKKHLRGSLFLNKVYRPTTLLEKRLRLIGFAVNFAKLLRTTLFYGAPPAASYKFKLRHKFNSTF